ncbi:MAG TPA: hypothetical protein VK210_17375 [Terriglobia bacterium]|nr:hypothetical protein [Terriglobia bacterium]
MTWDDVLTRMENAGLNPVEETYMENYGKILTAQRPEFRDHNFRCTYGVVKCAGVEVELYLFPDEAHRIDFQNVIGNDPWWFSRENLAMHFHESDPDVVTRILNAME